MWDMIVEALIMEDTEDIELIDVIDVVLADEEAAGAAA